MDSTKHLDWISCTFPQDTKCWTVFPRFDWQLQGKGLHGYQSRYVCRETDAVAEQDAWNSEMGNHITLSGSTLSELRKFWNITDDRLLAHIKSFGGRLSRCDLAINIHAGKLTPMSFVRAVKRKAIKSPTRSWRYIIGSEDGIQGMTFYMGNRESERFLRVYDKLAEQGIKDGEAWIRLELELKALRAQAVQKAAIDNPVEAIVNAQFDDFMSWPHCGEYEQALRGDLAPIHEIGRQDRNTERWLLGNVARALAREIIRQPAFADKFALAVDAAKKDLTLWDDSSL